MSFRHWEEDPINILASIIIFRIASAKRRHRKCYGPFSGGLTPISPLAYGPDTGSHVADMTCCGNPSGNEVHCGHYGSYCRHVVELEPVPTYCITASSCGDNDNTVITCIARPGAVLRWGRGNNNNNIIIFV